MKGVFHSEVEYWLSRLVLPDELYVSLRQVILDVSCHVCLYKETYQISFPDNHIQLVGRQLPGGEAKRGEGIRRHSGAVDP